jgi:para-nitrobenzyl esterase
MVINKKLVKQLLQIGLGLISLSSCKKDKSTETNFSNQMCVKSASTYTVVVDQNITYSQGLRHQALNSASYSIVDLKLDVYKPLGNTKKCPAILLIHGGGFSGGDKSDFNIVNLANHFTSRGWVAFSINYRLMGDKWCSANT